ncbi:MAG: glutamate synthase large subunit [Myxococcales bacterium]|jgi:glutamate synthase domain-containing protein 2/glutamate synthase domain-containing protein 1/glutamate synthase domain-containing protein 3|nr:glutamate synthase large subunit [Myxococcales bacterium]
MHLRPPGRQGLYDPAHEHDACGVGFVVDMKGGKSHAIIEQGLQILANLTHRGACGCDPLTGDGTGILTQMPDAFLRKACAALDIPLPPAGEYGAGIVFLPRRVDERNECLELFAKVVRAEGQRLLGWRRVPVDADQCGPLARETMPEIRQILIGRGRNTPDQDALERKLYVIRKRVERLVRESGLRDSEAFYVPSLSSRTMNYKGLLLPDQIARFYEDLTDPDFTSALALVHQRFSTNTFPSWERAHPYRYVAHNGEINTLRGNVNWMHARESLLASPLFGGDVEKLLPIIVPGGSDSAAFDNALEFLVHTGRPLAQAVMMMIPEAWQKDESMSAEKQAFYRYHACLIEAWDGPASIAFSDGTVVGAVLDRNGLRPSRYVVTKDGLVVMASEVGVLDIPPENVAAKGRLQPGRMFLVDLAQGRIIADDELKAAIACRQPYRQWLDENLTRLDDLPAPARLPAPYADSERRIRQLAFGYTTEDLKLVMAPMALNGQEAVGSMGTDTPLAVLSDKPQLLFHYFKQLFAQVTNPPIDPIREDLVMSLKATIGRGENLFAETPAHCRRLEIEEPVVDDAALAKIASLERDRLQAATLSILYRAADGGAGLARALAALCREAADAVTGGATILVLSDRAMDEENAPIPSLLATAAVHHHLIRAGTRTRCGLVVESGEPREVQHFALLVGYGAGAINPYLAIATIREMARNGLLANVAEEEAVAHYLKAANKGILKVMTKMGISTIQSYRGAQIFEAIGLDRELVDAHFTTTASRIGGIGLDAIATESAARHARAYTATPELDGELDPGGHYQWRRRGELHMYNPSSIAKLQQAVRAGSYELFKEYSALVNDESRHLCTLRGLLAFRPSRPIPLDQVEPASEIVKRFKTGAMSLGSISREAHENIAIAMNRIGGKSNTGEGGEDAVRYRRDPNGDWRRSAIKQVASGRFGVTSHYLVNADEIQIKMAQGAKPGEGGQLPGHKVDQYIAKIRYSTPGVGLISPPPHHDIYSIEDLSQLIHDLKNANDRARISVKLVAEVGVGTVAAGVAKAKADVVLVSGHDGGTGASPLTSLKHAGIPWELGLAETQQVLVMNDLRGRIRVETDGQLKTGRDIAVAALLGAEEFGFATSALVASGCILMRVCHLNTCPVGIATQDPVLRKKFAGRPEHVVNLMMFLAEELREIMAELGFRTVDEMVGRVDKLEPREAIEHWKARGLDLTAILHKPDVAPTVAIHAVSKQDHGLEGALDNRLIAACMPALTQRTPVRAKFPIRNVNRTTCTMLSAEISRRYGAEGLPPETITLEFTGSAGQSFGAFLAPGIAATLEGDANDHFGKGISGGRIVVFPPRTATFAPEDNIIVGNVSLYGATGGEVFCRGQAGERFAVRNSGATAVIEGVGDHGCEYMTKGLVVVLGKTGRNFGAGMSGGVAYVYDVDDDFAGRCNTSMVALDPLAEEDFAILKDLVRRHRDYTGSSVAARILSQWSDAAAHFKKVMPIEYRAVLAAAHLDGEASRLASI